MKTFFSAILLCVILTSTVTASDCHFYLQGDINNDCEINLLDVAQIAQGWLINCNAIPLVPGCLPLDIDGDGFDAIADCDDNNPGAFPGAIEFCDSIDNNCDELIDNDCVTALFVSKNGDDSNPGSIAAPKLTIQEAIDVSASQGNIDIYVSNGTYVEQISLAPGTQLYGGYSSNFSSHDPINYETIIESPMPSLYPGTVNCLDITTATIISNFIINGYDNSAPSGTSYAIYIRDCDDGMQISNNIIYGGTGGDGIAGTKGLDGPDGQPGSAGTESLDLFYTYGLAEHVCDPNYHSPGGLGGIMNCNEVNTSGGNGGIRVCPEWDNIGEMTYPPVIEENGQDGQNGGAVGGQAGWDVYHAAFSCEGFESYGILEGEDGQDGGDGNYGNAGLGGDTSGSVINSLWQSISGLAGQNGQHGGGGAGGGSGGGAYVHSSCFSKLYGYDNLGGTGGGGGSGACGGEGGTVGTSGGSSFGIFMTYSFPPISSPIIINNTIYIGNGGNGSDGGIGSVGGTGGDGAPGGSGTYVTESVDPTYPSFTGGNGGNGGDGGHGGGGGGGAGGSAYGIYSFGHGGMNLSNYNVSNSFSPGSAGVGGQGGYSSGNSGQAGNAGNASDTNF